MKKMFFLMSIFASLLMFNKTFAQPAQQCQSKEGITAYIIVYDKDNTCAGYFNNSKSYPVEVNWTITGIDKRTGQRVEVASGRSKIPANKTGNTRDTYICGGTDYRDKSYSIKFDLCD